VAEDKNDRRHETFLTPIVAAAYKWGTAQLKVIKCALHKRKLLRKKDCHHFDAMQKCW